MQSLMDLRHNYRDAFQTQHDVKLGIMGFFVKACTFALRRYPVVNASVDSDDMSTTATSTSAWRSAPRAVLVVRFCAMPTA